jgi:hypothetical protein
LDNESARQYDVSGLNFLYARTPEAMRVLEEAIMDPETTGDDIARIQEALDNEGFIDYLLNDEVPSVVKAAQRQGYDGIVVFENDDITDPSSAFIWNTDKVKQIEPIRETYEPTTQPEPVVAPAEPTVEPTPQPKADDKSAEINRRKEEAKREVEKRRIQLQNVEETRNRNVGRPLFNIGDRYDVGYHLQVREFKDHRTDNSKDGVEVITRVWKPATVDKDYVMTSAAEVEVGIFDSIEHANKFIEETYNKYKTLAVENLKKAEAELAALEGQTQQIPAPAPEPVAQRRETPEQIEEGRRQLSDQSTAEDIFAFVESIPEGTEFSFLETGETVTFEQSDQEGGRRAEMFVKNPDTGETRRALTINRKADGEISQRGFLPYIFTQQEQVPAITIKPKEDASPVRETEGQVQPEGQPEPAGRKDEGGENIQPPTEGAPEPTTVKKQPQEGEITQPTEPVGAKPTRPVDMTGSGEFVAGDQTSFYKIDDTGRVFLNPLYIKRAIQNPDLYLREVYDYANLPDDNHKGFIIEKFPVAKNDRLSEKGMIRFVPEEGIRVDWKKAEKPTAEPAPEPAPAPAKTTEAQPQPAPAVIDEIRGIWGDIIGEEATAEPTPAPAPAEVPDETPVRAANWTDAWRDEIKLAGQFVKKYKDQATGTEQEIAEETRIADKIIPRLILEVLADGKWLMLSRDSVTEAFPDEKDTESVMKAVRFLREEGVVKKYATDRPMAQFVALQPTPDPSAMEAARLQEIAEQQLEKTRKRKAAEREAEPQVTVISIDGMVETVRALGKEMWGNPSKYSPEKALAMQQLGQAVANVRLQDAETVALMYLMLADGDISVAEYDKFIQDFRFSNKLIGPAKYPESADPRPQEPPSMEPPTASPQAAQLTVTSLPVSDIKTDTKRFQARATAYSTETFESITNDAIAGKFDITKFNPIAIWKDPKDGQYYTLNHSRHRAFEYLSNYGPTLPLPGADFFKNIPTVDMSHLTEQEAINFAKDESNYMGTAETDLDGARRWKEKREQGQSTASIREDMKRRPNRARLELLSYLKVGGKAWDMIASVAKAETTQNRERAYQIGEFIGEARKAYPNLTDSHENEMFDYLFQGTGKKLLVRKDWMDRFNLAWTRGGGVLFDYTQPLNLENATTYGANEQGVIDEINDVNRQIKSLEKERSRTTGEARIAEINREIEYLSKRLAKLNKDRKAAREGDAAQGQIDLFGPPQPAPDNPELVGRDSPKFGKYIGKNNFGEIIYEDRNGVRTVVGDGGIGITEAVGMRPTNQGIQIITPNPSERGERFLTPQEIAEREVADQEQRSRTEQIQDKIDRAKQELKDIWNNEFGRSEGAMTGVSPKQFEAAGKLIAKAAELGVYKFEQIIEWIRDNLGARALDQGFDAFRAAYIATIAGNNVHNEDLNRISNYTVNDFQAATTKLSETEPAGPVETTGTGEDVGGLPGGQGGPTGSTVGGAGQVGDGDATGVRGGDGGLLVVDGTNPTVTEGMGGRSEPAGPRVRGKGVVEHALNHNNFQIPADFVHDATFNVRKKIEDNIAALELLAELKQHGAQATPGQMQTLFRYVGWGGLKDVLLDPEQPRQWTQTGEQNRQMFVRLHELINEIYGDRAKEIIDGMRKSALNAHYTAIPIVRAMYDVLEQAGLPFKNILEPSAGIGHFIGAMPQHMQSDSRWTGVELDPVTGDILKALYPGATIKNTGLEKANLPADFYDLVVGNIPFGKYKVWDESWRDGTPAQKQAMNKIHNYFFAKAIESAKPNGIIAFITTMGVLDSPSNEFLRKYIASNAEFLGAMRMPNTAFKANANTEVATDIIFLRKFIPGESKTQKHDFQKVVEYKNEFEINEYFARNPDMTFGEYRYGGGMYSESSMTIDPKGDVPIHTQISRAATKIFPAKVIPYNPRPDFINATQEAFANVSGDVVRNGNLVVQKGVIGVFDRGQFKPVGTEIRATPQAVSDYASLRTAYRNMVTTETQSTDEAVVSQTRQKLNDAYDNFVKQHGRIADNIKWIKNDIDAFNIMALEKWDDGEYRGKADMFSKRTINPVRKVDMVDSPQDAVVVTMGEYGRIVPERISQLLGVEWNDALRMLGDLVFELPEGGYMDRDGYLSGNVKAKLKTAKAAAEIDARFKPNVEALESVQPETVPISDIGVNMGARWIPSETYAAFLTDLLDTDIRVIYNPAMDNYIVSAARFSERQRLMRTDVEWGTNRADALDIAQYALNTKAPNFTLPDPDDRTKRIPDVLGNQEARAAIERMRLRFETWAKTEEPHATDTERIYNDRFVTTVRRNFDGSHLTLPGYAGPKLRKNQLDAIWMTVLNQGGIIDHGVGFGKSLTMIASAMEMKRMGIAKQIHDRHTQRASSRRWREPRNRPIPAQPYCIHRPTILPRQKGKACLLRSRPTTTT